ncbi:FAD-dependent oxidoreductase [Halorhodospira neutriphila]|uniref:Pyridine nucleotide-disulfide oxidoreductase n=1 Tax=Halorhodospira neutriphila TaxID=168379 RepID=A0ABS1E6X8_9GAMM|nr:FAD-dependent oxidoreductase [Halorhodospira neutriphila]MBK1727486.1 pyridine nucleotide-disulfide oxidoreductase [Halorhodospira neutriphila]
MSDDPIRHPELSFADLGTREGLLRLDAAFLEHLAAAAPETAEQLRRRRDQPAEPQPGRALSALLLAAAPHLEAFVAELFGAEAALAETAAAIARDGEVAAFKQAFVQRRARRLRERGDESFAALDAWVDGELAARQLPREDRELGVARLGAQLLDAGDEAGAARLARWCAAALHEPEGQRAVAGWTAFDLPQRVDPARLVELEPQGGDERAIRWHAPPERWRRRDGFELTDARAGRRRVVDQAHYCIYCHDHEGDFCARGFPESKSRPELGLKVDPLGITLTGCPLEERISEMNRLYRDARPLAALAVAMADNPMVPATGHRICNDCMKACIYQKQEPVDIPQIETRALTDVLALPYGVEIYHLLVRWNPLRREQYLPAPDNGRRVLIAGQGPAGFTMAHHLTMAGCTVVAVDGLKIEPLPQAWLDGPIRDWEAIREPLASRTLYGFGGVAEYGITSRWDKNFLKLIYLTLARRARYSVHGGVRLGGTLTLEDAWSLGFDHVCLATGAGYPRVLELGNSLARGMRQANDFLMALQLTGAGQAESLANLQVRMPVVVIGGGLTAVDTATEAQAHYIAQAEKIRRRYETLAAEQGEAAVREQLGEEDRLILDELLEHGRAVEAERRRAAAAGEPPDLTALLHRWGGATLAYRKALSASPAYRRNHEELRKAAEEGILFAEGLDPLHIRLDRFGHTEAVVFRRMRQDRGGRWYATGQEVELPARSVFVAAGTVPNTIYAHEHPGSLALEADHYRPHIDHPNGLQPVSRGEHCKAPEVAPFTSYAGEGRRVSFLGDTHPMFAGSVVQAIASARRSYPQVLTALQRRPRRAGGNVRAFLDGLAARLTPRVVSVERPSPGVAEIWVRAPLAAARFRPGQFFRLQTLESASPVVDGTRLQVPLLTVSGTGIEGDCIRLMVLQWGAPARVAAQLRPGDPVVLMGPTGAPTEIPAGRTVMVVAGRWGAAVMHDIGTALRAAGNRVLYIAAFAGADEIDHPDELEAGADQIVWATAREPAFTPRRRQDAAVVSADMVDLVRRYGDGEIAGGGIPLGEVDRLLVVGGTGLLRGFQQALDDGLRGYFPEHLAAVATVGSPMQCMLKGVCAQCLQWQKDPETGKRTRAVFSCAEQDQPLAWVDLDNLTARQQQNRLADRLAALWVERVLRRHPG